MVSLQINVVLLVVSWDLPHSSALGSQTSPKRVSTPLINSLCLLDFFKYLLRSVVCVVVCGVRDLSINGSSQWWRYGTADRIMMLVCLTCSAQRKRSTRLLKQRCQHSKNQSPSGLFSSQTRGREREKETKKKERQKNGGKKKRKGPAEKCNVAAMLWQCGGLSAH